MLTISKNTLLQDINKVYALIEEIDSEYWRLHRKIRNDERISPQEQTQYVLLMHLKNIIEK